MIGRFGQWWRRSATRYAVVRRTRSEVEAMMLRGVLDAAGIPAVIRSRQMPLYGDVLAKATGVWGDLLVPVELAAAARVVIEQYLDALRSQADAAPERDDADETQGAG